MQFGGTSSDAPVDEWESLPPSDADMQPINLGSGSATVAASGRMAAPRWLHFSSNACQPISFDASWYFVQTGSSCALVGGRALTSTITVARVGAVHALARVPEVRPSWHLGQTKEFYVEEFSSFRKFRNRRRRSHLNPKWFLMGWALAFPRVLYRVLLRTYTVASS